MDGRRCSGWGGHGPWSQLVSSQPLLQYAAGRDGQPRTANFMRDARANLLPTAAVAAYTRRLQIRLLLTGRILSAVAQGLLLTAQALVLAPPAARFPPTMHLRPRVFFSRLQSASTWA